MGVVYYANYFIWMEIGRVELVRSRGLNYKELEHTEGLFLSVVDANCRYVFPARYDQEIAIQTQVSMANSRMVEFAYEIRNAIPGNCLPKVRRSTSGSIATCALAVCPRSTVNCFSRPPFHKCIYESLSVFFSLHCWYLCRRGNTIR